MLSNASIKSARPQAKPYQLYDTLGLHLLVMPRGGRWWRFKFRFDGKEQMLSLGIYPVTTLKQARDLRDGMLRDRANGINPAVKRRAEKRRAANDTFEAVAREWFDKFSSLWVNGHSSKVIRRLELYLFPWIGAYPIAKLSAPDILVCLRRVEADAKLETAKRALQNCSRIFRYAIATGRAERNPAVDLQGSLPPAVGSHLAAITNPRDFADLLRKIESYRGSATVRLALRSAPFVFVRPGELRSAEWSEMDFSKSEWHIPAAKMKMRGKHIVPLSRRAISILRETQALSGTGKYVFPSPRSSLRPLSNVALLAALRRMGYEQGSLTVHGFRSTASTMLNEQGKNRDWIERQLAHGEKDRHPLRTDARGRPGLKIRRGLGTSEATTADALVADMNELLSDPSWWNATRRQEAELKFAKVIVDAFYDEIQAGRTEPSALREQHIRMPSSSEDKYTRVLLVGTTGAGKTTLVRQLIGSDPDADRFPSTAPAKTTISDIEVVLAEGGYEAAVTFFTEFQVQANIEECISDACLVALDGAAPDAIAKRLLNHRDQRFRLSYILGGWRDRVVADEDDDLSFEETLSDEVIPDEEPLTDAERHENRKVLESYIARITAVAESAQRQMLDVLGIDLKATKGADLEAARQLIEESFDFYLQKEDDFHELTQDILDSIRTRFDFVQVGEFQRSRSGWPELWTFKSTERRAFIGQIRWFSSNYWPQFGRLLTPLVDGIRVKGPLFPHFLESHPKLVLIDGQGLGHTPDSSASVTTHITRRFGSVDVILLVDNATQPMQAASLAVLRAIAASGHHDKLAIAFTRFDQINGKNLQGLADKSAHVMASVRSALASIRDSLGTPIVRAIEQGITARCFMLGGVDRQLNRLPARAAEYMRHQLQSLVGLFERAILPPPPPAARPIYDPTGLSFAVQEAVSKFQGPWLARLGLGAYEGIGTAHWATVKALNRRIAGGLNVEYSNLQPVADMVARLSEAISRFLDKPLGWSREPTNEQEEQSAIAEVRRAVSAAIHDLAMRRLIDEHLTEWRTAYDGPEYSGKGSTFRRARAIHGIYDSAAPLPDAVMTSVSMAFLSEVRIIVSSAVESSGGRLRLGEAA